MARSFTVITGASEGIGREFAKRLAMQGRHLVLVARNMARLDALAVELSERHAVEVRVIAQDLGAPGAARAIVDAIGDRSIDCLINNAGYQVPIGRFADTDADAMRSMILVNVVALTDLTRLLLPAIRQMRGAIVNVASHAAFQPVPYMGAYAATKAYVLHMSEALSRELADADSGVYVMAFCPGATRTQFWSRSGSPVEKTRFPAMEVERVVDTALRALRRRRKTVVIPGFMLNASTQSLRLSTRSLNLILARMLTGYTVPHP